MDVVDSGAGNNLSSFDVFEQYYKAPWQNGYDFGDIVTTLGRLTRFPEFVGKSYDEIAESMPDVVSSVNSSTDSLISNNTDISDALTYGNVEGSSVEDKFKWLIEHDPQNARGWIEQYLQLLAGRENTENARSYEEYVSKNKVKWLQEGLKEAGINPILAYQYLGNSSSSVGTAGSQDLGVGNQAVSRENTQASASATDKRTAVALVAALTALAGIVLKKKL